MNVQTCSELFTCTDLAAGARPVLQGPRKWQPRGHIKAGEEFVTLIEVPAAAVVELETARIRAFAVTLISYRMDQDQEQQLTERVVELAFRDLYNIHFCFESSSRAGMTRDLVDICVSNVHRSAAKPDCSTQW
ncbi:MAG: hypothetical protein R3F41_01745 [Gammaproteobacteria bacterium]|nr:hypothetical protein [Pseudomonadales bacterium]MCP5345978.1 hypothetical protein [Pseudomonadales bacterium]